MLRGDTPQERHETFKGVPKDSYTILKQLPEMVSLHGSPKTASRRLPSSKTVPQQPRTPKRRRHNSDTTWDPRLMDVPQCQLASRATQAPPTPHSGMRICRRYQVHILSKQLRASLGYSARTPIPAQARRVQLGALSADDHHGATIQACRLSGTLTWIAAKALRLNQIERLNRSIEPDKSPPNGHSPPSLPQPALTRHPERPARIVSGRLASRK